MKTLFILSGIFISVLISSCGSNEVEEENTEPIVEYKMPEPDPNAYDSLLAQELGADEYGMKMYVMAFLKSGPTKDLDSSETVQLQIDHMNNIQKMADEGTLVLAGPFGGDGELRGIYLFDVATIEEAEALTNTDPAVKAGTLNMDLQLWYGSAALLQINDIHKRISKENH